MDAWMAGGQDGCVRGWVDDGIRCHPTPPQPPPRRYVVGQLTGEFQALSERVVQAELALAALQGGSGGGGRGEHLAALLRTVQVRRWQGVQIGDGGLARRF